MCKSKPEKVLWLRICGAGRLRQSLQHPDDKVHKHRIRWNLGFGLPHARHGQASTTTPSEVRCLETLLRVAEKALHSSVASASVASNPVQSGPLSPIMTVLTSPRPEQNCAKGTWHATVLPLSWSLQGQSLWRVRSVTSLAITMRL